MSIKCEVGDKVNYHSVINPQGPVTSTDHTVRGVELMPNNYGTNVAWITGRSGCVAIDALSYAVEPVSHIDTVIKELFSSRWSGNLSAAPIEDMRKELAKTLRDQMAGYWSGHTAYHIAVDGGFLIDSKRAPIDDSNMAKGKRLTEIGRLFMDQYA